MPNRLSHSQCEKYRTCPQAWHHHYVNRYRPIKVGSALPFGSAIGKAFEHGLKKLQDSSITKTIYEEFDEHWNKTEINGIVVDLKTTDQIEYSKYDLDKDLGSTPWESLRRKGHIILSKFENDFLPHVTKVYSTEEKVELFSGEDSSVGYADAVVDIATYDKPIIIDFKTTSMAYDENSVAESVQLSQYLHTLGEKYKTRTCGYVVFSKNIIKNKTKECSVCGHNGTGEKFRTCNNVIDGNRCEGAWNETINPEAKMQVIIDEIPEEFELSVIDSIGEINDRINSGIIDRNLSKCENNGYNRRCEYFNLCHNNNMDGLVQLENKALTDNKR